MELSAVISFTLLFSLIISSLFLCIIFPNNLAAALPPAGNGTSNDMLSLLSFKSMITEDPFMALSSWNESSRFSLCSWTGVVCNSEIHRVTALNLTRFNLAGTLTPHLGNLSFITFLDLSQNSFRGNIPSELGKLGRLKVLNMSNNLLEGQIPSDLSNCTNLTNLALDHNKLIAMVPPDLGSLAKLLTLYVGSNHLTGTVPSSFGNFTSLRELDMSYNYLIGEVPHTISQLKKLHTFRLSVNNLTGEFPPSLYNLTSLSFIALSFNNLTGNLRPDMGLALPNLERLWLAVNFFTGIIPISLSNATNLRSIYLTQNTFNGKVPLGFGKLDLQVLNVGFNPLGLGKPDDLDFVTSLTNCSNLQSLDFQGCQFVGILPLSIANLSTKLTSLYLQGNMIRGKIPREISNLRSLSILYMNSNFLNGTIPDSFGNLPNLEILFLGSNQLSGRVPPSLGNITHLSELCLVSNSLEGEIPSTLANCKQLSLLRIAQNNLTGIIPPEIMTMPFMLTFNMSNNSLTGTLPSNVANLSQLVEIDLSYNFFSGEIPNSLGSYLNLNIIFLQDNWFSGRIPDFSHLSILSYLDLSKNNLSGNIPNFLASFPSFISLNLSSNNLEGAVPSTGVFLNASATDIRYNPKLCGGSPEFHLQACPEDQPQKSKKHGLKTRNLILVIVFTTFFGVLSLLLLLICWIHKKPGKCPKSSSSRGLKFFPKITYEELWHATEGFSSENLIGSGSFGTVYKGTLSSDGTSVAVKVLNLRRRGAFKSFMAECQALRNIRHNNLVKVITACSSCDFHGDEFKALVYPFMPKGSLDKFLHAVEETPHQLPSLSILQRINVVVNVAAALNYLHHQCETPVIHCDLKPQNVLLDNDMTAHVGDFGLARLVIKLSTKEYMNQFSSLGIKGSIGYAAPEYGMGARVWILGDIYSFGILLLEVFTGKRPTDNMFTENLNLHHFVKLAVPERVDEILDSSALCPKVTGNAATWNEGWRKLTREQRESLTYLLQIGIACSSDSPKDRMNMHQVYRELVVIRGAFPGDGMKEHQKPSAAASLSNRFRAEDYIEAI